MRDSGIKDGKIVFVSSMLGMLSFAGWSTYSPTKYAIRGLADTLRNELKRYGVGVHIFFPGGIESPGFDIEVKGRVVCVYMYINAIHWISIEYDKARGHQDY
jgi:short-subunit dehydrogenase